MVRDHRIYLELPTGSRRSDVFKALGLPIERRFRLGSIFGKPTYDGWYLDEGPGTSEFLIAKVLPSLDMRDSDGVELFFDKTYRLRSLWFERPFTLPVHGVRFGMSPNEVVALHGEPIESKLDPDFLCYMKFQIRSDLWLNVEFAEGVASIVAFGPPETV